MFKDVLKMSIAIALLARKKLISTADGIENYFGMLKATKQNVWSIKHFVEKDKHDYSKRHGRESGAFKCVKQLMEYETKWVSINRHFVDALSIISTCLETSHVITNLR